MVCPIIGVDLRFWCRRVNEVAGKKAPCVWPEEEAFIYHDHAHSNGEGYSLNGSTMQRSEVKV
jgi:hypothetical protein